MTGIVKPSGFSSQCVALGPRSFSLWWGFILVVHLITFGYNTAYALFYQELQKTYMYMTFEFFGIGMVAKHHHVIATVHVVIAALHGICILLMIVGSIRQCALAFVPWRQGDGTYISMTRRRGLSNKVVDIGTIHGKTASRLMSAKVHTVRLYSKVWGRQGVLGVNGVNFHSILIVRELVETALQTQQAYRMSWYLPRWLLNRFYLCFLVLNCWSSVFIYSLLFKKNEARRRFACLLCDCILDLISCMGVPLIIVLNYVGQYNSQITGFDMEKWYDEVWSAHVLNEFQMVLVTSWSDLISRTVFSFGLLSTITSLKELLRRAPSHSARRTACGDSSIPDKPRHSDTNHPMLDGIFAAQQPQKPVTVGGGNYDGTGVDSRSGRMMLHLVHLLFAAWGVILLGLHIQASLQARLPQCILQVHPWAAFEPACYLALLDCHELGISGKSEEVEAKWSEFDRSSVIILAMRHCPTLKVPAMITDFHQVRGIKVYNSTIDNWGTSAAITNTNHPEMYFLFMIRVNLTDGVLPLGLHDVDFPHKLYDIELCYTNLREVPEDLDSTWMIGTMIYIEYSQLTSVPQVIMKLDPYYLALTGNPITELPPEIFEVAEMQYLGIGSTLISELPRNVTNLSPLLSFIYVTDTNVSYFWLWIEPLLEKNLNTWYSLFMGGSTYCAEVEKLTSGEATRFSVMPSPEYSPIMMDSSEENRAVILRTVNCELVYAATFYPIALEDANSALA